PHPGPLSQERESTWHVLNSSTVESTNPALGLRRRRETILLLLGEKAGMRAVDYLITSFDRETHRGHQRRRPDSIPHRRADSTHCGVCKIRRTGSRRSSASRGHLFSAIHLSDREDALRSRHSWERVVQS